MAKPTKICIMDPISQCNLLQAEYFRYQGQFATDEQDVDQLIAMEDHLKMFSADVRRFIKQERDSF
jgi:hypothetical protein